MLRIPLSWEGEQVGWGRGEGEVENPIIMGGRTGGGGGRGKLRIPLSWEGEQVGGGWGWGEEGVLRIPLS